MTRQCWIVSGSTGEYSDARDWGVRVFTVREDADAFAAVANDWLRERSLHRSSDPLAEYEEREAAVESPPEWDSGLRVNYTGTAYCVVGPVPLEVRP